MDETARQHLRDAITALDEGMQGIVRWMYTLKPVLRNELLQMTGPQMEKLREARNRLAALLGEPPGGT
jgi:predicted component of type VI protein secretion system